MYEYYRLKDSERSGTIVRKSVEDRREFMFDFESGSGFRAVSC